MDSFRELANLCADVVAKVEDSKEARPAVRPYSGRNCYAGLASFESSTLATTSAQRLASFSELANLRADVIAKVEDSKEARPAIRPYSGRNSQ